jgi:enoyl-CoA hydratase/carnithine racemase
MTKLKAVNYAVDAGAATIELNRPESLNAWSDQLGLASSRRSSGRGTTSRSEP